MEHPNAEIMRKAIDFGLKNNTVGCIIVKDDEIIAAAGGTIISEDHDATGHSEINAIRAACRNLGTNFLKGCWLYTTFEPCPMCTSAACWADMEGIVYAASRNDRNERWKWVFDIPAKEIIKRSERQPRLVEEFMREESLRILDL